jgi:hypothetical protein
MRLMLIALLILGSYACLAADAVSGRVMKVLPFLMDTNGLVAKSPSLFDRDAYQAYLLAHTNDVSGMRFDVQWKADKSPDLKVRVELRGVGATNMPTFKTLETTVKPGRFSKWTEFTLTGDDFRNVGNVVAWRATLWNGDAQIGEQQSFLW